MSIEIFLVMASSGVSHTARAVRLWVGIVSVGCLQSCLSNSHLAMICFVFWTAPRVGYQAERQEQFSRRLNRSCVSVVAVDGQEATWRWLDQSGIEALGSQNLRTEQTQRWAQFP